jgi:S1-C subfamily serine protease
MLPRWPAARLLSLGLLALCLPTRLLAAEAPPAPGGLDDLKAIQARVKKVLEKVAPSVVGVQLGDLQGSGVIVQDRYVLTAAHVGGRPGFKCVLVLPDGRRLNGMTVGWQRDEDVGLIEILDKGKWPSVEMGESAGLQEGQWVLSLGHPGGYKPGRPPVVRLGRVLGADDSLIRTDCTLWHGDSGGPLFDLDGKVVGIHSSIGSAIDNNNHVPIDAFRDAWDLLVKPVPRRQQRAAAVRQRREAAPQPASPRGPAPSSRAATPASLPAARESRYAGWMYRVEVAPEGKRDTPPAWCG